jgi:DNA polymerase-3 subunit delta'
VQKSSRGDYTDLFLQLKDMSLDDAYEANRFLEVLSFLLTDMLRALAHAPLRLPETTQLVGISNYPRINATAIELALVTVQETMSRIDSRRISPSMSMQALSLKLFEGYK